MYKTILFFLITALIISSCKDEDVILPAVISDITISPLVPGPTTAVIISAIVKDSKGIVSVKLYYSVAGGSFVLIDMSASGDNYTGTIPPQKGTDKVQYYIEVVNTSSLISYGPTGAPGTTASYEVGPAPLISKVAIIPASPTSADNVSVSAIITDPKGITGAKLFYKVDNGIFSSLTMNVSSSTYSVAIPAQVANSVVFYYIEATNSQNINSVAPETAPSVAATYTVNGIFMNEVWSWGLDPDFDWIELYNSSAISINIGGYKVYDSGGQADATLKIRIPDGTIIPAKGFYTVITDDPALTPNFGLSKKGEEIWFENASGIIIDNFVFVATTAETESFGRKPDGSAKFFTFTEKTKNTTNNNAATLK